MPKQEVSSGEILDPEAWADANAARLRYFGCRICDLGPELTRAVNVLWDKGFRRGAIEKYLVEAGTALPPMSDQTFRKHFDGDNREHGRT